MIPVSNLRSMNRFSQILMLEYRMQKFLKFFKTFSKIALGRILIDTSLKVFPILVHLKHPWADTFQSGFQVNIEVAIVADN